MSVIHAPKQNNKFNNDNSKENTSTGASQATSNKTVAQLATQAAALQGTTSPTTSTATAPTNTNTSPSMSETNEKQATDQQMTASSCEKNNGNLSQTNLIYYEWYHQFLEAREAIYPFISNQHLYARRYAPTTRRQCALEYMRTGIQTKFDPRL